MIRDDASEVDGGAAMTEAMERASAAAESTQARPALPTTVALSMPAIADVLALRGRARDSVIEGWSETLDPRVRGFLELRLERLYVGAEFCSLLLPGPGELRQALEITERLDLELSFASPPLPQEAVPRLRALLVVLEKAASEQGRAVEVTVSDFGTLRMLRREMPHLRPVLGRALAKIRTDTQLALGCDGDFAGVLPQYQRNSLTVPRYRAFLRGLGVERVELDWPEQGLAMDLGAWGLSGSLHLPFVYTTCGRRCLSAVSSRPLYQRGALVSECHRECRELEVRVPAGQPQVAEARENEGFLMRGNVVFHRSPRVEDATPEAIARHGFDRVVLSADRMW